MALTTASVRSNGLADYDVIQLHDIPTFRRNISPPCSGSTSQVKKPQQKGGNFSFPNGLRFAPEVAEDMVLRNGCSLKTTWRYTQEATNLHVAQHSV
jgi:hypothetical protein